MSCPGGHLTDDCTPLTDVRYITEEQYREIRETGMFEGVPHKVQAACPECGVIATKYATFHGICVFCDRVLPAIEEWKAKLSAYRIEKAAKRLAHKKIVLRRNMRDAMKKQRRKAALRALQEKYGTEN